MKNRIPCAVKTNTANHLENTVLFEWSEWIISCLSWLQIRERGIENWMS